MPPDGNNLSLSMKIAMVNGTNALIPSACTMPPLNTQ